MTNRVWVGVSGFSYASWRGKFYPETTKSEEFLPFYSKNLRTVEINSSFYAPPRAEVVKGWGEKVSKEFRFSFKAPKLVTHTLKLGKGSAEASERFSATLEELGEKRGPALFQLPPFLKQDQKLLEGFLTETSKIKGRVFEFRHESWLQDSTYELLEKHGAGFCVAETEDLAPVLKATGGLAYFRLRLDSYDAKAVDAWAGKIGKLVRGLPEAFVYLRHDETGENAVLAKRLAEKLSV
ncbi:MAG: DUF72 domain-containing protein [archaeon]|nr:MAG: DUF72 domain-containing protein [archaeon]